MTLESIIKSLDNFRVSRKLTDFKVKGISCDSTKVSDDFIFVAIKGNRADGHKYIPEAVERGARAIVASDPGPETKDLKDVPVIIVPDTRVALGKLAAEFYQHPSRKIKVVGVTGTNGKTTVTYLLEEILKEVKAEPAVLGTVNYRFRKKVFPSINTTPGPLELQSFFAQMLKEKVNYALMEVSSHALDQHRTEGIDFHSAIFTNLTQDHLDYHPTLEDYFQAKAKLFINIKAGSLAVINNDDAYGKRLKDIAKARVVTYGIDDPADYSAVNIKFGLLHTEFMLVSKKHDLSIRTALIGKHNVYNVLAAVAWAIESEFDVSAVKSGIEKFPLVPGRLERVKSSKGFEIFVDYAHTEDALKNVISSLRCLSSKRIIVVFGCGGERDRAKRPLMGRVVTELADLAMITSDNPRSENPLEIIGEIKKGIKKDNFIVIPDRKQAIKKALILAKEGDIVLVAGKGHETYQILENRVVHFDDREVIKECLRSMK